MPAELIPAAYLLAFHDEYGARNVATGRIRRFVEAFEYRAWKDAQVTPGHQVEYDFRAVWRRDVQRLADMLSYEPDSKRYGYYAYDKRKWYMKTDAIVQRLQHEGEAWVTGRKVRDAIALRKSPARTG